MIVVGEHWLSQIAPLATEGAMCIFHTFERNAFKDLQPAEKKSGSQYKCSVLILKIVYECIVSNETSLKQLCLEIKSYCPFLEITLLTVNSQFFGMERCYISHSTFCNKWNVGHALIEKVLFDKYHLLSKLSYILSSRKCI